MKKVLIGLLVVFTLSSNPVVAKGAGAGESDADMVAAFAKVTPAVAALYYVDDEGSMNFICSTTAVGEYEGQTVLLTAYHCVRRGVSYRISFDSEQYSSARVWKIPGYEIDDTEYPRGFNDPETDMAMFLTDLPAAATVDMAEQNTLKPGENLIMVGFPLGQTKTHYRGSVAGGFDRPGHSLYGYQTLQIFGAPGSSGSAVIDVDTGKIVSVLVQARQGRAGLPVIYGTPIEYRKFLEEVPVGKVVGVEE